MSDSPATPLRALVSSAPGVAATLGTHAVAYADGGEARVLEVIRSTSDLRSTSSDLFSHARTWSERYHFSTARANVLRALELRSDATVLEVGAGCGAISRYLGETCAVVDSIEPMPDRAEAAAARTRDLPNVQVVVTTIDDVPEEPVYDYVVVVGVLEYVGSGLAEDTAYEEFLSAARARLRPGGTVIVAIENKLGAKYLAGAPEDHTARQFDSVEGYPTPRGVRTFSRQELEALAVSAGLEPATLVAFPDYKLTRAVLDPQISPELRALLWEVPEFPSPDWDVQRRRVAEEALVWRSLVEAGLAADTGNSFVCLAHKPGDEEDLWPQSRQGLYFSSGRRSEYTTVTEMVRAGETLDFVRKPLIPAPDGEAPFRIVASTEQFVPGTDLDQVIGAPTDDPRARQLLDGWAELVRERTEAGSVPLDLLPHNIVLTPDGTLVPVDQEWVARDGGADRVLARGALVTALRLRGAALSARTWPRGTTVRDAAMSIGTTVGLADDGAWLAQAVLDESTFLSTVIPTYADLTTGDLDAEWRAVTDAALDEALVSEDENAGPDVALSTEADLLREQLRSLGEVAAAAHLRASALEPERDHREMLEAQLLTNDAEMVRMAHELDVARRDVALKAADVAARSQALEAVRRSTSWRVTAPLRAAASAARRLRRRA